MEAFGVYINNLKIEYGICQKHPYIKIFKKMQRRSNNAELFRRSQPHFGHHN